MSEKLHRLAQLLPGKTSLDECSLEELQHITRRFPFFAPAQFLLLQKLKETGSPDYEAQHRKAVLYFHDPLLFDYFISDKYALDEAVFDVEKPVATVDQQQAWPTGFSSPASITPRVVSLPGTETAAPELHAGPASNEEVERSEENAFRWKSEIPVPPPVHPLPEAIPPLTEPDKVEESEPVEPAGPAALPALPFDESRRPVGDTELAEPLQNEPQTAVMAAPPLPVAPAHEEETAPAESRTLKPVQPGTGATLPLSFEPYHTVDYFASQGIKVTTEELPKDRLSSQLRSFTEWLKVMKRLPTAVTEATPQTTAEKSVERLASHSVEGSDVVTEAMAEVWARQGNKGKAIETYNKLSLLNPSKKAYFAAKIENLSRT